MDTKGSMQLTVGDKTYRIGHPGWMVRIKAEEHIREKRRVEFDAAMRSLTGLPPGDVREACIGAFNTLRESAVVDAYTVHIFFMSHSGTLFLFRSALDVHHPGISQEEAEQVFNGLDAEQYREMDEFLADKMFPEFKKTAGKTPSDSQDAANPAPENPETPATK